jgi:hypothetical protein
MRVCGCFKHRYDQFMLISIIRMLTSADLEHNTKRYDGLWRYLVVGILSSDRQTVHMSAFAGKEDMLQLETARAEAAQLLLGASK